LDFAGNTVRLGPINDPVKPSRKNGKGTGEAPIKICDVCGSYNHASVRVCADCGAEFEFKTKLKSVADTAEVIRSDLPVIEWLNVKKVIYTKHIKAGSPPILKVTYFCGLRTYNQFICFEHSGYPKKIAHDWWQQRSEWEPPEMVWQALTAVKYLRQPTQIRVHLNKKYPEIIGVRF
jgi:DNA repair protein RadD